MHRKNPSAKLLAIGCFAERAPESLIRLPGVTAVAGNKEKERILEIVAEATVGDPRIHVGETRSAEQWTDGLQVAGLSGRTRAYLKVQDGCSQHCTYCIVPRLRGRGRSQRITDAVDRARLLADNGFREIVVTGVALGTYGLDLDLEDGLAALLAGLEQVRGLERIRLGSVEPWAVSDKFLHVIAESEKICPHLHIPLQSCCDEVLRRMNRRYCVGDISRIFDTAYSLRDDWGFGSDIICGFPGESAADHSATQEFLSNSPISYLHVFPYSQRPGTPATKLPNPVNIAERKRRAEDLKQVDRLLRRRFRERFSGRTLNVLFENRSINGLQAGHAGNYLDVFVEADPSLIGRVVPCKIIELHPDGVIGAVKKV